MKIADILRSMLDAVERNDVVQSVPAARDDLQNFSDPAEVASNNIPDPHDVFIPPLQTKLELLKKAVGVENIYDNGTDAEQESAAEDQEIGCPDSQQETSFESELAKMKKSAGINPGVMQELSNDEPLDD